MGSTYAGTCYGLAPWYINNSISRLFTNVVRAHVAMGLRSKETIYIH